MATTKTEMSFMRMKSDVLARRADSSRKGTIDVAIRPLVAILNDLDAYATTSCCSGRSIVIAQDDIGSGVRKKGCQWIMSSHDVIVASELELPLLNGTPVPNTVFKFEPFILHVLCRTLEDAQKLLVAALESGFRNSGFTLGKKGKIMLAVRSTHGLEVPLTNSDSVLMVDTSYLHFIVEKANDRFQENQRRIDRFQAAVEAIASRKPSSKPMTSSFCADDDVTHDDLSTS